MLTTLNTSLNEELRPTLRAILREDLGPAFRDALTDPVTQEAVGAAIRVLARQTVLGMQDGMNEISAREKAGITPPSTLTRLETLTTDGTQLIRGVAIALAILVVALLIWLARTRGRATVATRESARRESALLALAQAIKATQGQPWGQELHDTLDRTLRHDEKAEYLHELWRKNKEMRLGRDA